MPWPWRWPNLCTSQAFCTEAPHGRPRLTHGTTTTNTHHKASAPFRRYRWLSFRSFTALAHDIRAAIAMVFIVFVQPAARLVALTRSTCRSNTGSRARATTSARLLGDDSPCVQAKSRGLGQAWRQVCREPHLEEWKSTNGTDEKGRFHVRGDVRRHPSRAAQLQR